MPEISSFRRGEKPGVAFLAGLFTLTFGVEKSADLTNFFPLPMTSAQTPINAEGKLEFRFTAPDNAAFFRLEAR